MEAGQLREEVIFFPQFPEQGFGYSDDVTNDCYRMILDDERHFGIFVIRLKLEFFMNSSSTRVKKYVTICENNLASRE